MSQKGSSPDTRRKHRILAPELKPLQLEIQFTEDGLSQLEKMVKTSAACEETKDPFNLLWKAWFEGPKDSNVLDIDKSAHQREDLNLNHPWNLRGKQIRF